MRILHLSVLGDPRLTDACGQVFTTPGPKSLAMLASLASTSDLRISRALLAELVWGDATSTTAARHALRQCLFRFREQLGGAAIVLAADDHTVWLRPDWVAVDLHEARAAINTGSPDRIIAQSNAIRGRFCAGLHTGVPDFDNWLCARQSDCDLLYADLHRRAATILAERGEDDAAIAAARRRIDAEPFQDAAHAALITLCCRLGHRQAAAEAHAACHRLFQDELGVPPAPEVDAALATPIRPRRNAFQVFLPQDKPGLAHSHRVAGAFFAGLSVAAVLFQIAVSLESAPDPAPSPATASLWVSAASASHTQAKAYDLRRTKPINAYSGKDDNDGNTEYAPLYPAGC